MLLIEDEAWNAIRSWDTGLQVLVAELESKVPSVLTSSPEDAAHVSRVVSALALMTGLLHQQLETIRPLEFPFAASETDVERTSDLSDRTEDGRKRRKNTKDILLLRGVLCEGTEIVFDPARLPYLHSIPPDALRARFGRNCRKVWWKEDQWSLSALTEHLRDRFGVDVNQDAVNGFKYWCLATDTTRTLWEIAEEQV